MPCIIPPREQTTHAPERPQLSYRMSWLSGREPRLPMVPPIERVRNTGQAFAFGHGPALRSRGEVAVAPAGRTAALQAVGIARGGDRVCGFCQHHGQTAGDQRSQDHAEHQRLHPGDYFILISIVTQGSNAQWLRRSRDRLISLACAAGRAEQNLDDREHQRDNDQHKSQHHHAQLGIGGGGVWRRRDRSDIDPALGQRQRRRLDIDPTVRP